MSVTTKFLRATLLLTALFGVSACSDRGHEHTKDAPHAHADDGPAGEKLTHFTERTELFVEFPRLVINEPSPFAVHLTRLSDFKPVAAARVTVILSGGGQPEESFATDTATQPGIFRPQATPRHTGERDLAIEVATSEFTVRHQLGPVTIHANRKAADAASTEVQDANDIGFTKEQQWKVDFAVAEAVTREIRDGIQATGRLRARPDGEALLTAQTAGQVQPAGAFPHLGQAVTKGTILAYLVPRLGGDTDIATLQASAHKAKVELDQAILERARLERLFRDEAVPEKRVFSARATAASAQADYEAARRRLDQYGGSGGGVPVRAPVAGSIADVHVSPGTFAQEGQLLFHIADRRALWLELRVPETEAARTVVPGGAAFRVEGVETSFEVVHGKNGKLIASGAVVDAQTRTLPVVFEFSNSDARLRIGMAVKAQLFFGPGRKALAVPAEAVVDDSGVPTLYIQTSGESFQRRPVRLGARDGDWVEVVDGLQSGQRVVTRGAYLVKLASTKTGAIGHGHAH